MFIKYLDHQFGKVPRLKAILTIIKLDQDFALKDLGYVQNFVQIDQSVCHYRGYIHPHRPRRTFFLFSLNERILLTHPNTTVHNETTKDVTR